MTCLGLDLDCRTNVVQLTTRCIGFWKPMLPSSRFIIIITIIILILNTKRQWIHPKNKKKNKKPNTPTKSVICMEFFFLYFVWFSYQTQIQLSGCNRLWLITGKNILGCRICRIVGLMFGSSIDAEIAKRSGDEAKNAGKRKAVVMLKQKSGTIETERRRSRRRSRCRLHSTRNEQEVACQVFNE